MSGAPRNSTRHFWTVNTFFDSSQLQNSWFWRFAGLSPEVSPPPPLNHRHRNTGAGPITSFAAQVKFSHAVHPFLFQPVTPCIRALESYCSDPLKADEIVPRLKSQLIRFHGSSPRSLIFPSKNRFGRENLSRAGSVLPNTRFEFDSWPFSGPVQTRQHGTDDQKRRGYHSENSEPWKEADVPKISTPNCDLFI